MSFNLATALSSIAPTIATLLGGPMVGAGVSSLLTAFGLQSTGNQDRDITAISGALQSGAMTPEIAAAIRIADQQHAEKLAQQGIDVKKMNMDQEAAMAKIYVDDAQDARKAFGQQQAVFWLGISVLVIFATVMTAVLYAAFQLLAGGIIIKDVSVVAAISGLVGSVVGYVAANAQQVVGYFFGSSAGSSNKTDALGKAVEGLSGAIPRQ